MLENDGNGVVFVRRSSCSWWGMFWLGLFRVEAGFVSERVMVMCVGRVKWGGRRCLTHRVHVFTLCGKL